VFFFLDALARDFAATYPAPVAGRAEAEAVIKRLFDFIGRQSLLAASPAYRQGDWMAKVIEAATQHLETSCKDAKGWNHAIDVYEGVIAVPLMTIHKSKGLEYHTVIFVGLDDDAWFAFQTQTKEETCGFFVAFTRAKATGRVLLLLVTRAAQCRRAAIHASQKRGRADHREIGPHIADLWDFGPPPRVSISRRARVLDDRPE
jgi:hypothetical protein